MKRLAGFAFGVLLAVGLAAPTSAAINGGEGEIEFYAGINFPAPDILDDDIAYGIRLGYNFTEHWGAELTVGRYETSSAVAVGDDVFDLDYEETFIDGTAVFHVNPDSKAIFMLFGGAGWAFHDWELLVEPDDDELTLHAGAAGKFYFNDRLYLRVDARARWFEERDDDKIDIEGSLGFGIEFGG